MGRFTRDGTADGALERRRLIGGRGATAALRGGALAVLATLLGAVGVASASASVLSGPVVPATSPPAAGSYSGPDSQGHGVSFYVSGDGTQVQDVSVNQIGLTCSDGSSEPDDNFSVATAAIDSGSFSATSTTNGVVGGKPATLTYTFTGQFGATGPSGELSEVIAYSGGSTVTCSSGNVTWSASQTAQGSQTVVAPQAGSYSGPDSQGHGVSFYVSGNRKQVQDISVNQVGLSCSNGASQPDGNFSIASAPITSDTTFTATSTQALTNETITYTLTGHFHGLDTSGNQRAAGQLTEVIKYKTGTSYTCTSDQVYWSAGLTAQGSQTVVAPQAGSYSGPDSQGHGVSFSVSSNGSEVQNLSVNQVGLSCSNGTTQPDDDFTIPSAPITSETTFTASSTTTEPNETITYTFNGHFHGLNTSGETRAAGQLDEVITDTGGTTVTCTSDNLNWTATA
jgi:hypothetical protein